jgi:hypothetical protein
MYKNNLVLSISCEGNFLQENKEGEVLLPFQSEYSVFLKNKYSRKVMCSVFIDGKDVLNGRKLVLKPNDSFDLERFVENNLEEGRKFRFIKKTEGIVAHRGNKPEDSLVEVRYKFEYIPKTYLNDIYLGGRILKRDPFSFPSNPTCTAVDGGPKSDNISFTDEHSEFKIPGMGIRHLGDKIEEMRFNSIQSNSVTKDCFSTIGEDTFMYSFGIKKDEKTLTGADSKREYPEKKSFSNPVLEDGITVKGSESFQKFKNTYSFQTEQEEHVMIIKLKGTTKDDIEVVEPVTKNSKKLCPYCGKKWDFNFTYCPDDSGYLEIE